MHVPSSPRRLSLPFSIVGAALVAAGVATACQEPAGLPPTLDSGSVSFTLSGRLSGTITAEGPCYFSEGYPPAESSCALALDLGDTLRIRAIRDARSLSWVHVNLDFPPSPDCFVPGTCGLAMDFLTSTGKVDDAWRATFIRITVQEETEDRLRGFFSGRAELVGGEAADTVRIIDGTFDVPVER